MEILGKNVAFMQNIKHDTVSYPTNYPSDFSDDWANLGPLPRIMEGLK